MNPIKKSQKVKTFQKKTEKRSQIKKVKNISKIKKEKRHKEKSLCKNKINLLGFNLIN